MIRQAIEKISEGMEKNQIRNINKVLGREFGRNAKMIGQFNAEKRERSQGDFMEITNDRVKDYGSYYAQWVFEINGKILVVAKNVGTHKGLIYLVFESKKDLKGKYTEDIEKKAIFTHLKDSYKSTTDLTKLLDVLKG